MNIPTVRVRLLSAGIWVSLLSTTVPSYAGLIGTWTESMNGASVGIHNEIQATFSTVDEVTNESTSLFDAFPLTVADVGRTITVASTADDPEFLAVAQTLTNGIDDWISLFYDTAVGGIGPGGGGGTTNRESLVFGTTPDFIGFHIDAIMLTLDHLSFQIPAPDPLFPDDSTAVSVTLRVDILGTPETTAIPEPPSAIFMCLGFGLFLASQRGRQILDRPRA